MPDTATPVLTRKMHYMFVLSTPIETAFSGRMT